jgi:hypothetical protein
MSRLKFEPITSLTEVSADTASASVLGINITALLDVTPCSLVDQCQYFGGTSSNLHSGYCIYIPSYTVSQPRRENPVCSAARI